MLSATLPTLQGFSSAPLAFSALMGAPLSLHQWDTTTFITKSRAQLISVVMVTHAQVNPLVPMIYPVQQALMHFQEIIVASSVKKANTVPKALALKWTAHWDTIVFKGRPFL